MVWNAFMRGSMGDPLRELERLHRRIDRLFAGPSTFTANEYPAIELWNGEDGIRLHAQLPGVTAADIDLSVVGDNVTLKGTRREREAGRFVRTIQLPFPVEGDAVRARFKNGVLEVELPRAASDKPRKITVQST